MLTAWSAYLEYVDRWVSRGEPVAQGTVVILQHSGIIVQHGQLATRVAQECTVPP